MPHCSTPCILSGAFFLLVLPASAKGMCSPKEIPMSRRLPLALLLLVCALVIQFFLTLYDFIVADIVGDFTPEILVRQLLIIGFFLLWSWSFSTQRGWLILRWWIIGFEVAYLHGFLRIWTPPSWSAFLGLPVLAILDYLLPVLVLVLCLIAFLSRPFHTAFFNWWRRCKKG
jgi:hypothetical protein